MYFELYRTFFRGDWRWRLKAFNHRILATSGEGYRNRGDCILALQAIAEDASRATKLWDDERGVWTTVDKALER